MKKKILVLALAVAMLALPMSTVFAKKPERIPLAWCNGPNTPSTVEVWWSGNIQHGRLTLTFAPFFISWDDDVTQGNFMSYFDDPDKCIWDLTSVGVFDTDYSVNMDTGKGVLHFKAKITFSDGTFEGNHLLKGQFEIREDNTLKLVSGTWDSVMLGTGAYQGWKIVQYQQVDNLVYSGETYIFKR